MLGVDRALLCIDNLKFNIPNTYLVWCAVHVKCRIRHAFNMFNTFRKKNVSVSLQYNSRNGTVACRGFVNTHSCNITAVLDRLLPSPANTGQC